MYDVDNSIVIGNTPPFSEDRWLTLSINGIKFHNVKPCSRCKIPNVDPEVGEMDLYNEPSTTLDSFRRGERLGFILEGKHKRFFGSNFVSELPKERNTISTGDTVHVLNVVRK